MAKKSSIRPLLFAVGTLLIVIAVLVGIDYAVRARAVAQIEKVVAAQLNADDVTAEIHAFPVITQMLSDHAHHISLQASQATLGSGDDVLRIRAIDVDMKDVRHWVNHRDQMTAGQIQMTGLVPWDEFASQMGEGMTIAYEAPDKMVMESPINLGTTTAQMRVVTSMRVGDDGALYLDHPQVSVEGLSFIQDLVDMFAQQLENRPLAPAIDGYRYDDIQITAEGVKLTMSGNDVEVAHLNQK